MSFVNCSVTVFICVVRYTDKEFWQSCGISVAVFYLMEFHWENVKFSLETTWDSM